MTQASAWVKTQKLCHNYPAIYLFSWEREILIPQTLFQNFKNTQGLLKSLIPQTLFQNFKNSAPPLQFVTPGRQLIQKSTKSMNFQHFLTLKVMNF